VDETYVSVKGKWCYLYRAIDRDGNVVDSLLSEKRAMEAAKRFFKQALDVASHAPERVTADGHDSYPRALRETLGHEVITAATALSTIGLSKTIAASNSAIIPCVALEVSSQRLASAVPLTNYATTSVLATPWGKRYHWQNNGECSLSDLRPCKR
jgi:hypothetical protein